jgi:HEAT repeat protein
MSTTTVGKKLLIAKVINLLSLDKPVLHCLKISLRPRIKWEDKFAVSVLIEALKDDEGEVRWHAAWVLSKIPSQAKDAVPALIEALKDEEGEVRRLAAKTLESMGSAVEIPVSVLKEALEDNEIEVRSFASRTLAAHFS